MRSVLITAAMTAAAVAAGWIRPGTPPEAEATVADVARARAGGASVRAAVTLARQRALLASVAPAAVLALLAGLAWGLAARSRVVSGESHASPAAAWAGRRAAMIGTGVAATAALSPLGIPAWATYLAAAMLAAGAGLLVANLPPRL